MTLRKYYNFTDHVTYAFIHTCIFIILRTTLVQKENSQIKFNILFMQFMLDTIFFRKTEIFLHKV